MKIHCAPIPLVPISQRTALATCVFALALITGSASAEITEQHPIVTGSIPKPGQIWVYDLAATPADIPADSALNGRPELDTTPPTDEQLAQGKKLGAEIAKELVRRIRDMGMPAERATKDTRPQRNDLLLRGYLVSIREGDAQKRFCIGFGEGASEMKTAMEGFQVTTNGLRRLGYGTVSTAGSKTTPGAAVGVAGFLATKNPAGLLISGGMHVYNEESGRSKLEGRAKQTAKEIAEALKVRFQEQCWIN